MVVGRSMRLELLRESSSVFHDQEEFKFAVSVRDIASSGSQDVVEVPVAPVIQRRKKTLSDVQLQYFEGEINYYKLKMQKLELEIKALERSQEMLKEVQRKNHGSCDLRTDHDHEDKKK